MTLELSVMRVFINKTCLIHSSEMINYYKLTKVLLHCLWWSKYWVSEWVGIPCRKKIITNKCLQINSEHTWVRACVYHPCSGSFISSSLFSWSFSLSAIQRIAKYCMWPILYRIQKCDKVYDTSYLTHHSTTWTFVYTPYTLNMSLVWLTCPIIEAD